MPNYAKLPPIVKKTYGSDGAIVFLTEKQYNYMVKKLREDRQKVVNLTAKTVYYRKVLKDKIKEVDNLMIRIINELEVKQIKDGE